MDKKFLDKVVNQIVNETMIDYRGKGKIFTPFSLPFYLFLPFYPSFSSISSSYRSNFFNHCKEVYGLNEQEIEYVWEEYKQIIIDKINNGL
tara:strand:- start:1038 stop:1310 length:273 start_codon:yes stop_codon:yes gene_type:complete